MTQYINEITQEQLDTLARIDKNCIDMHIPPPIKMFTHIQVHDKDNNLELDYKFKNNSWVRNAYNLHASAWLDGYCNQGGSSYGAGTLILKQTNGILTGITNNRLPIISYSGGMTTAYNFHGGAGADTMGIVVGTGSNVESFEDYSLGVKIAHGTSTGQLSYSAQNSAVITYDAITKKWSTTYTRIFNNNSNGSIVINEVGIYASLYYTVWSLSYQLMVCRDKLGVGVAVANGSQLTVNIIIETILPS
jgi:hypothetical protein